MPDEHLSNQGGFHIRSVHGNFTQTVVGDIVARDKITSTTTTTSIWKGFAAEPEKKDFQSQIDQLREALRTIRTQIEAHPSLSVDQKEEAAGQIISHSQELKEVKERTADIPTGKPAAVEVASAVETTLKRADGIVDKLKGMADKTAGLAETVGKFAATYGPLLAKARQLFGL